MWVPEIHLNIIIKLLLLEKFSFNKKIFDTEWRVFQIARFLWIKKTDKFHSFPKPFIGNWSISYYIYVQGEWNFWLCYVKTQKGKIGSCEGFIFCFFCIFFVFKLELWCPQYFFFRSIAFFCLKNHKIFAIFTN